MFRGVALIFVFFTFTVSALSVKKEFIKHEVDKAFSIKAPEGLVAQLMCQKDVWHSGTAAVIYSTVNVEPGQKLKTGEPTPIPPTISFEVEPDQLYCFLMLDPDAPKRSMPLQKEVVHWIIGNVAGDASQGEEVVPYLIPGPPPKSGEHRYTFLVYKQPGRIDFSKADVVTGHTRMKFKVSTFAQKYNLGDPIAGNFFLYEVGSETDDIVKPTGIV